MRARHQFLFIFLIAAIAGCKKEVSKKVDQTKIWTSYELFYDENTDKTYVDAVFRFSSNLGTVLELSDPSEVQFDGEVLEMNPETGHYEKQISGLQANGTFKWMDTEGRQYTNTIEIRDIAYATLPDTLYQYPDDTVNFFFTWAGDALDTSEAVELKIDGSGESDTQPFSVDSIGATMIEIDTLELREIEIGDITLFLDKKYSPVYRKKPNVAAGWSGVIGQRTKPYS